MGEMLNRMKACTCFMPIQLNKNNVSRHFRDGDRQQVLCTTTPVYTLFAHYPTILGLFSALNYLKKFVFKLRVKVRVCISHPKLRGGSILEAWKATQTNLVPTKAVGDNISCLRYKEAIMLLRIHPCLSTKVRNAM